MKAAPKFEVNLDLPPRERWQHIVQSYVSHIPSLIEDMNKTEKEEFGEGFIGKWIVKILKLLLSWFCWLVLPQEIIEEIKGIAKQTEEYGLKYEQLLMLNLGYDFVARCTSLVVNRLKGSKNEAPLLLRNMDWDLEAFRGLVIEVDFQKKGKTVYKGTSFVFTTGLFTGMRVPTSNNEGYCVSLNYRKTNEYPHWNLLSFFTRGWPSSFLIRHILESVPSYRQAIGMFATNRMIAPCYFIVSGSQKGEGSIITRNRTGEVERLELTEERDHIIQTNIDHWMSVVDPVWAGDDFLLKNAIQRRSVCYRCFQENQIEQTNDNTEWCFRLLGTPPVCNVQTLYSTLMSCNPLPCHDDHPHSFVINFIVPKNF